MNAASAYHAVSLICDILIARGYSHLAWDIYAVMERHMNRYAAQVRIEVSSITYGIWEYRSVPINGGTYEQAYAALDDVRQRLTTYGYTFGDGGMGNGSMLLTDRGYLLVAKKQPFQES